MVLAGVVARALLDEEFRRGRWNGCGLSCGAHQFISKRKTAREVLHGPFRNLLLFNYLAQTPPHTRDRVVVIGVKSAKSHAESMAEVRRFVNHRGTDFRDERSPSKSVSVTGIHFVLPPSTFSLLPAAACAAASRAVSTR